MGSSISAGFFDKSDSWALAVLAYCSWEDRYRVFLISRKLLNFQRDDLFWKWMCSRLEDESSVYSPSVIPPSLTFKTLFKELYPLNQMWSAVEGNDTEPLDELQSGDKRKISVYARFCPRRPKADALEVIDENNENENTEGKDDATEVTLPLHQRLAMIKMSHRLTNNRQALKVLTSEGGKRRNRTQKKNTPFPQHNSIAYSILYYPMLYYTIYSLIKNNLVRNSCISHYLDLFFCISIHSTINSCIGIYSLKS